jgi:hypothetical protein
MCPYGASQYKGVVVHMSKLWRGVAVATVACGLAATGTATAMAAPATAVVTIMPHTQFHPVTNDYFVSYRGTKGTDTATLSGTVTGATSGEVAQLFEQRFPFHSAPVPVTGQSLALTGPAATSYSFTATPTLATKYQVEVLTSATSTTTDGVSAIQPIYVVTNQPATWNNCGRPVCRETMKVYTFLPARAYGREVAKKWYFYFGLALSPIKEPPPPRWLYLRNVTISTPKRISSTEFERTIKWSFRIGNNGYRWNFNFCSKDTEASDGINLPGRHSCGVSRIRGSTYYLG